MQQGKWPHDDMAAMIAFYGDPRGANGEASVIWMRKNLVPVTPPFHMVASWAVNTGVRSIQFHRAAADALDAALSEIWRESGQDQAQIERWGVHLFGGSFNFRPVRGRLKLSCHAFGCAVDFDPSDNALGSEHHGFTDDSPVVKAFKRQGAVWGGDFKSRKDAMHFQFATE